MSCSTEAAGFTGPCWDIIEAMNEAVFIHDADTGEVLDVNQAMLRMFGCSSKEEVLGFMADRFSLGESPYSMAEVTAWIQKTAAHGPQLFKWRSRRMDGSLFWSEVSLTTLESEGRKLILAVIRDLTGRATQGEELQDSRSRYRALFEKENRDVIIFRPMGSGDFQDFIVVDMNSSAERTEKVSRSDIVGRSMLEVFPGARQAGLVRLFQEVHRTGRTSSMPLTESEEGRIISWREMAVSRLPSGEIAAVCQDRTKEKITEEALRKQEFLIEAIVDALPAALCLVDAKRRIFKWVSPYIEKITGYTPEELLGKTPRLLYPSEEEYQRVGRAYRLFSSKELVEVETKFMHKDGRPIHILLKAIMKDEDLLCVIFDITERKRAETDRMEMERHLLHVQKLESLGVLAGGIAHDFNNLLLGILGNAELLSMTLPTTSRAKRHLGAIVRAADRASALCSQMLAYAGQASFETERLDVSRLVRGMQAILMVSVTKQAMVNFRLASDLPLIKADPTQMNQVIMNLVTNSSEAIGASPGSITISTGSMYCSQDCLARISLGEQLPEGEYVYIEVADNGCGMEEAVKKRVFEPFFTTRFTGRGLGMAAVHGIVRAHRGGIEIESEPGSGTRVRIMLPAAETAGRRGRLLGSALPYETKRPLVLLVDDEPEIRSLAQEMLELCGCSCLLADSGLTAIELFRGNADEVRCVILDLSMPEMDGEKTLAALRGIRPEVKIIISSGYDAKDVARRFEGLEISGFLKKPYRLNRLQELLGRVMWPGREGP